MEGDSGIGRPTGVQHLTHVDLNYNWSGAAEEVFQIEEKLGEGYGSMWCIVYIRLGRE